MSTTCSQSLSIALTVISANIEGLSAVKASMLSDLCKEQHCHCLCLQETHRDARKAWPRIPVMTLITERPHDKYGSAIFIRDDLKVKSISVTAANHVEVITAELPDVVVHSVYRQPGAVCTPSIMTQKTTSDCNRKCQQSQHHMGPRRHR